LVKEYIAIYFIFWVGGIKKKGKFLHPSLPFHIEMYFVLSFW